MVESENIGWDLKRLIGLDKVAEMLDVSRKTVERKISAGELPRQIKIGKLSKMKVGDVLEYIEKQSRGRGETQTQN